MAYATSYQDIILKMVATVFCILAAFIGTTPKMGVNAQAGMSDNGKDVNISALLNSFQMGYDKRVRPNYGGIAVTVGVSMYVLSISRLSEVEMVILAGIMLLILTTT
jgi:gamma-aminobutyric acid receptor subunit beta